MNPNLFDTLYAADDFKEKAQQLVAQLSDHLQKATMGGPTQSMPWQEPESMLAFWENFLARGKEEDFITAILERSITVHHPNYMGHQVAVPAPITVLTAMLSALLSNGTAVYEMGMSSAAIEEIVVQSVCKKIGFGPEAGGFLTSGGTLANLTALLAARRAMLTHDVWNLGYQEQLGIMVCEEAHYCIDRAAKIMGLGSQGIIKIPARADYSMDVGLLESYYQKAKEAHIKIFAIVGSAPSTSTGAYDDLETIAQFAQEKKLWFHVDGAHGGAAIYSPKYKHLLNGAEKAHSMVIDGHKMMLMPTLTTALLFADKGQMQNTFSQKADYLLDDTPEEDWINSGKKTFECTKNMMSLHWYILLKVYGESLFDQYLTRQYDLAKTFAQLLQAHPNFELAVTPQSNIVCFRWVNDQLSPTQLNQLNAQIREHLLKEGSFYIVQTKLKGQHYLRVTLMNPFTSKEHLIALMDAIALLT